MSDTQPTQKEAELPVELDCLEVWGGNGPMCDMISVPGLDVAALAIPYEQNLSGGDILYASRCGAGRVSRFAVVDVAGHGDTVSDLALTLRKLMRKHISTANQTKMVKALNKEFGKLNQEGRFATAAIATYFAPTDHLILCNAGHPLPLWLNTKNNKWTVLDASTPGALTEESGVADLPLGVVEPTSYHQIAVGLSRGDVVIFYTDSLIEAVGSDGSQLGTDGLMKVIEGIDSANPVIMAQEIYQAVLAQSGAEQLDDDVTIMVLRHNASNPPRMTLVQGVKIMSKMLGIG